MREVDGFVYADLVGAVPRIVSLIASATEIVDCPGAVRSRWWAARTSAIIPEAVLRLPVCTRPRIPVDGSSARSTGW